MLAAALNSKKRPAPEPVAVLELPTPPIPSDEVLPSPQDNYIISLYPGESVVLGRNSHGRLGETDVKYAAPDACAARLFVDLMTMLHAGSAGGRLW